MDTLRSVCYQLRERVPELGAILSDLEAIIPKIVVVGAQSAGKSSLLNRLLPEFLVPGGTGAEPLFSLPTSAGTCTKFPVTLSFIVTDVPYMKLRAIRRDGTVLYDSVVPNDPNGGLSAENLVGVRQWINEHNAKATAMFDAEMFLTIGAPNTASYALVDLPGLTLADRTLGPVIEAGVRERVREADIIVVCKQINADIMDCQAVNIAREERKAGAKVLVVSTYADTSVSAQHLRMESDKVTQLGWRLALSTTAARPPEEAQWLRSKHASLNGDSSGILCGSHDLRCEINTCYQAMLAANAPAIRTRVMELNKHIQQCLDDIGHEPRSLEDSKINLTLVVNNIGRPVSGEVSPFDTVLEQCISEFESSVPLALLEVFLSDESFIERVMREGCRSKGIRGTEGLYEYLSSAYRSIARDVAPAVESKLAACVAMCANGLCDEVDRLLSGSTYSHVRDALKQCVLATAESGTKAAMKATGDVVTALPSSEEGYPHNFVLFTFVDQMVADLAKMSKEFQGQKYYAHNDIASFVHRLSEINSKPTEVVRSNVRNVIEWYWKEYRNGVIKCGKQQLRECAATLLKDIRQKAMRLALDDAAFMDEDDAVRLKRANLRDAAAKMRTAIAALS